MLQLSANSEERRGERSAPGPREVGITTLILPLSPLNPPSLRAWEHINNINPHTQGGYQGGIPRLYTPGRLPGRYTWLYAPGRLHGRYTRVYTPGRLEGRHIQEGYLPGRLEGRHIRRYTTQGG